MKARWHIIIHGYVQGVGFRWFVLDIAESLHLAGWVRNLPGGSVEAVFEGDMEAIEQAIKKCSLGPSDVIVSGVESAWNERPEDLIRFDIKY